MSQQPTQQGIIGVFLKDENADPLPVSKIASTIEQAISAGHQSESRPSKMKYLGPCLIGIACLIAIGVVGNYIRQGRQHHQRQNNIAQAKYDAFMKEKPTNLAGKQVSPSVHYQNIKVGMTIVDVDNLLVVKGVETSSAGNLLKNMALYRWDNPNYPEVVVLCVFQDGKLISKRLD
jgi:hypothetical protein